MSDVELAFREGVHRVGLAVAGFLPGVLSMLLVLAFALALASLVRFALRRSLAGIDFDGASTGGASPFHRRVDAAERPHRRCRARRLLVRAAGRLHGRPEGARDGGDRRPREPDRSTTSRTCSRPGASSSR